MVLSADRPVMTSDVLTAFGLHPQRRRASALHGTLEAAWLLGLHPAAWSALVRNARSPSPALLRANQAIFLRWLAANPGARLHHLAAASPLALRRALEDAGVALLSCEFSIALGCDASAASRWSRSSDQADPIVRRICAALLAADTARGIVRNWQSWLVCARQEARLRGLGDDLRGFTTWYRTHERVVPRPRGAAGRKRKPADRAADAVAA